MNEPNERSRLRKLEKRRKNTQLLSIIVIIAGVLLFVLLAFWIFGGKDDEPKKKLPDTETSVAEDENSSGSLEIKETEESSDEQDQDQDNTDDPEEHQENEENHHVIETTEVEPSDDNVIEAYTGDWPIVKTTQEGPHTINYSDGSLDRIEIKEGVMLATGLNEDLITWRVGNGGDQKVIATVSDRNESKIYRVYLSWIENQGWQPTKVESLKENDKQSS